MGAPLEICSKRGVVAVLASGLVISLTALTGGIAPAFAQPDDDVVVTTVMPEPEQSAPEPEEVAPEAPAEAPAPAPAAPAAPAAPVAPVAPVAPAAPQTQAPQFQAPQAPAADEPEPEPEAPASSTAVAPPVTAVEPAEPAETEEADPTTVERAPATAPSAAAETPESPAPASESKSADESKSVPPSAALVPGSEASEAPASGSTETPTSGETTTSDSSETSTEGSGDESETPTVSIAQAAKEIETVEPQTLDAPAEDVQLAKNAKPILEPAPAAAPEKDVAAFSNEIETSLKIPGLEIGASSKTEIGVGDADVELVSNVRQWRPEWIEYDEYYRPIFMNPYRDPVRIVYIYDMRPRIMIIPPLARMVLEVAQYAAYSFTAAVLAPVVVAANIAQTLTNIAVGSFFGGGYFPGVGLPLPPPPPPVLRYDNVPVFVNYSNARYEPFRVRQIVDVGDDAQFGERKVLLDGATPAWGVWTQSPTGERQFEVHRTQQFPGLDAPAEGPLPGDYRLRLASDEAPTGGLSGRDVFLMVAAGVIGTLGFGAIGLAFFLGRRRSDEAV